MSSIGIIAVIKIFMALLIYILAKRDERNSNGACIFLSLFSLITIIFGIGIILLMVMHKDGESEQGITILKPGSNGRSMMGDEKYTIRLQELERTDTGIHYEKPQAEKQGWEEYPQFTDDEIIVDKLVNRVKSARTASVGRAQSTRTTSAGRAQSTGTTSAGRAQITGTATPDRVHSERRIYVEELDKEVKNGTLSSKDTSDRLYNDYCGHEDDSARKAAFSQEDYKAYYASETAEVSKEAKKEYVESLKNKLDMGMISKEEYKRLIKRYR